MVPETSYPEEFYGVDGQVQPESPSITTCLFDLDETLYALSVGLAPIVKDNIRNYMVEKLNFDPNTVEQDNFRLFSTYGTTMAGLRAEGYKFDFDDYHEIVHGPLPYHFLKPDPLLRSVLKSMPQRKFVFTNSDRNHAAKCLKALGLEDCFEKVIYFENLNEHKPFSPPPYLPEASSKFSRDDNYLKSLWESPNGPHVCCKPQKEAFLRALDMAGANPAETIFFDDSKRNISAAKKAGLFTVLVGTSVRTEESDWALESLHNVKEAIPELWVRSGVKNLSDVDNSVAVEAVRA